MFHIVCTLIVTCYPIRLKYFLFDSIGLWTWPYQSGQVMSPSQHPHSTPQHNTPPLSRIPRLAHCAARPVPSSPWGRGRPRRSALPCDHRRPPPAPAAAHQPVLWRTRAAAAAAARGGVGTCRRRRRRQLTSAGRGGCHGGVTPAARVAGRGSVVSGRWSLVGGQWSRVSGRWSVVAGRWSLVAGRWPRGQICTVRVELTRLGVA